MSLQAFFFSLLLPHFFLFNALACTTRFLSFFFSASSTNETHFSSNFLQVLFFSIMLLRISLKLLSAIFYKIFIFHQMTAFQKLWKVFFVSSRKLLSFLRYSNFCIYISTSFSPCQHCFRGWSKKNLKVYDVINCPNKNLITHFVWYLEKEISSRHWNFDQWWSIK